MLTSVTKPDMPPEQSQGILVRVTNVPALPTSPGAPELDYWPITVTSSNIAVSTNPSCTGYAAPEGLPPAPPPAGRTTWPTLNDNVTPGFPQGSLVIRARYARFYIADPGTASPKLMLDPDGDGDDPAEPLALGIEDMQIAVGVDVNGDGALTEVGANPNDDEIFYNVAGDNAPLATAVTPWRAVRVTLVAKSVSERTTSTTSTTPRPAAEDRIAGVADVFRRRVVSVVVELRTFKPGL